MVSTGGRILLKTPYARKQKHCYSVIRKFGEKSHEAGTLAFLVYRQGENEWPLPNKAYADLEYQYSILVLTEHFVLYLLQLNR